MRRLGPLPPTNPWQTRRTSASLAAHSLTSVVRIALIVVSSFLSALRVSSRSCALLSVSLRLLVHLWRGDDIKKATRNGA